MKKLYQLLISILILVALFTGCTKEKKIGEYLLGAFKNEIPYTGNETLVFLDNSGDSMVFKGQGRSSYTIRFYPNRGENGNYYLNETDTCRFIDEKNIYQIRIDISSHLDDLVELYFSLNNFHITIQTISSSPLSLYDHGTFFDSFEIDEKYYHDVWYMNWPTKHDFFYYSRFDGFVKFEFEDGTFWVLKEIIP